MFALLHFCLFHRGNHKVEDACEMYARAANMFKMAKNWTGKNIYARVYRPSSLATCDIGTIMFWMLIFLHCFID